MNKFVRRIVRQKKQQEQASYRRFNAIFKRSINLIVSNYTGDLNALIASIPALLSIEQNSISNEIKKTWGFAGRMFGLDSRNDTIANSKGLRGIRSKDITDELWESTFEQNAINYISTNILEKTNQILKTQNSIISNKLKSILVTSIENGLSIEDTSKLISSDFKKWGYNISKKRARVIARTEVNSAANYTQRDGALSIGVPLQKNWSTSGLSNIRPSHIACEAQGWIDFDLKFVNSLGYPGDQSTGDVGEFINCRCTAQFRAKLV